jgi:hypothetical protein
MTRISTTPLVGTHRSAQQSTYLLTPLCLCGLRTRTLRLLLTLGCCLSSSSTSLLLQEQQQQQNKVAQSLLK